jgi:hypothetical protein
MERVWDEEQLCLERLPQIVGGFRTKIQRSLYELSFNRNSLENLGTLEFDEIWPTKSLLYLVSRKNKFQAIIWPGFEFLY